MKAKENSELFMIDALKNRELNGYLIFTDAEETGEGSNIITNETKPGVDFALREAGFHFEVDNKLDSSSQGLYWMKRGEEHLRYHPIRNKEIPLIKSVIEHGMKTRIDFFCKEKSDALYDVVNELLKLEYQVFIPPLLFKQILFD